MKRLFLLLLLFVVPLSAQEAKDPIPELSEQQKQDLVRYLKDNWKSPEEYVAGKFAEYDLVFIGEYHRIKHDAELIQNLIPWLYKAGVYHIGVEFGCHEYQDQVDSLLVADEYDEDLVRKLVFKWRTDWGYKEYMDIYRKAWELNQTLGRDAPKFRIVHLNYRPNWTLLQENMTDESWKKIWYKGDPDPFMAGIITEEFLNKNVKALIYSGCHHSFTHYYQPVYDFKNKKLYRLNQKRMGNIIYHLKPDKVFQLLCGGV